MTNQCQRAGCPRIATHAIKLCAADDQECNREALLPLRLCAEHAEIADVGKILAHAPDLLPMLGLSPSDGGLVFAESLPLGSMEFRAWSALNPSPN